MKLTFWGAARTVTGSMHELEVDGKRYLLDCGQYQGRRQEAAERNSHFPWPASQMDAVLLSHAHIDHSGNLPLLGKNGFSGPIYSTSATIDLCGYMLADAAHIQEKDAEFINKRQYRRKRVLDETNGNGVQPLFTTADVDKLLPQFTPVEYRKPMDFGNGLTVEYFDAGHLIGSAALLLRYTQSGQTVRLIFSGDIGRANLPILRDPDVLPEADYLIMESTYGNRLHSHDEVVLNKLADTVNRTCNRGGRLIVPAFAVGRTQQLVLMLHQLSERHAIPNIPIFIDSPLAVNATEVYRRHPECYDTETAAYLKNGDDPFGFTRLKYIRDVAESKALNDLRGPMVVVSASGMCEAGRILHHLKNNIGDPRNTILIVGFQAENTLGRKIVDKLPEVPIFGEPMRLRAEVVKINELSGHADQGELLQWMKPIAPALKRVFLVHGEVSQSEGLAAAVRKTYNVPVEIPNRSQSFTLQV